MTGEAEMKSILLNGMNHFGMMLAKQLSELGHEVMAVDRDEEKINTVLPLVTDAEIGDSTNEAFLRSLGINNFDVCIVAISSTPLYPPPWDFGSSGIHNLFSS